MIIAPRTEPAPYRVPWRARWGRTAHPLVENIGVERADFVRAYIHNENSGEIHVRLHGRLLPGESFEVCLCGCNPDAATVTVAWYRPEDGQEYLWRFVR